MEVKFKKGTGTLLNIKICLKWLPHVYSPQNGYFIYIQLLRPDRNYHFPSIVNFITNPKPPFKHVLSNPRLLEVPRLLNHEVAIHCYKGSVERDDIPLCFIGRNLADGNSEQPPCRVKRDRARSLFFFR